MATQTLTFPLGLDGRLQIELQTLNFGRLPKQEQVMLKDMFCSMMRERINNVRHLLRGQNLREEATRVSNEVASLLTQHYGLGQGSRLTTTIRIVPAVLPSPRKHQAKPPELGKPKLPRNRMW